MMKFGFEIFLLWLAIEYHQDSIIKTGDPVEGGVGGCPTFEFKAIMQTLLIFSLSLSLLSLYLSLSASSHQRVPTQKFYLYNYTPLQV
jgi:hypothetical protein